MHRRLLVQSSTATFVDEVRITRPDEILGGKRAAVEHELLELGVRAVEQRSARRLVDASGLHADETILDEIDDTDTVLAADLVQPLDQSHGSETLTVHRHRRAALEADDNGL